MAHVYILRSLKSGKYYIGSALDLDKRLKQHNAFMHPSSKRYGPFELVFKQEYPNIQVARNIEYRLKRLKRRDYINKIITEGRVTLSGL